jgi:hypothetical protein
MKSMAKVKRRTAHTEWREAKKAWGEAGVCINCKEKATWYSPAGYSEYILSGLCEPCFGKITSEGENMKYHGSDVEGTINNDHALAAEKYLRDTGYDAEWQVVVADDKVLMLDYDNRPFDEDLPEQFYSTLSILEQRVGTAVYFTKHVSKGGNTHAVVALPIALPIAERIAWQATFGSDPKREALHLLSVARGELNPILLFMRKDRQSTGVDEHGNSVVQASSCTVATPENMAALGIPSSNVEGDDV